MAADPDGLPFDPVRIQLKVHQLRQQLHGLETLLETYGFSSNGSRPVTPAAPEIEPKPRPRLTARRARRSAPARPDSPKPKLADLGVAVILKHGGKAHGKVIVSELKQQGHMLDVAHPDSNISTALSRDPRVKRDPTARNTWIVTHG